MDKELAGRIQQIQLLGRDIRGNDYERVWNQLEAEIHLHRHKTVIRACRAMVRTTKTLHIICQRTHRDTDRCILTDKTIKI